jgi:hypothetical protein
VRFLGSDCLIGTGIALLSTQNPSDSLRSSDGCSLQQCSPSASSSAAPRKRMSLYPFLYILHPYVIQICNQKYDLFYDKDSHRFFIHILHSPDRCIANELSLSYNLYISAFELLFAVIEQLSMCNFCITVVALPISSLALHLSGNISPYSFHSLLSDPIYSYFT